jgi:hypothetical protein
MSDDDSNRTFRNDLLIASAMVAAGLTIFGLSAMQLRAHHPQMAQATQPLQSTPGAETKPSGGKNLFMVRDARQGRAPQHEVGCDQRAL